MADVDLDQNTEIVVNSAYAVNCPLEDGAPNKEYVDDLHSGVRCDDESGCQFGAACINNLCRCTGVEQCCPPGSTLDQCGLTCTTPRPEDGGANVCRATHPNSEASSGGIRVLRDGLDRWTSSRPLWNQHAYSVTNINDDGSIPGGDWRNWNAGNQRGEALNTYRANVEGDVGVEDLPDITGRFSDDQPCIQGGASGKVFVQASVCNRGKRAVGAALPATFFLGPPEDNNQLCTSFTDGPVPTGSCKLVFCEISGEVVGQQISLVVNRDAAGNETVFECRPENNTSDTMVADCPVDVVR